MVQEGDAEHVPGLPEPGGEGAILRAGRGITGGVIVGADQGAGVHEEDGLEDLPRVDNAQGQGADRDDVDADNRVFGVQPADEEVLTVEVEEEGAEGPGGRGGVPNHEGMGAPGGLADKDDLVPGHVIIQRVRR